MIPVTVEMTSTTASGTFKHTPSEWRSRKQGQIPGYGRPTAENLQAYIKHFEASTKADGCNSHLGLSVVFSAFIRDQRTGEILATYRGPSFVAFGEE
jgi:hypothetical protein